MSKFQAVVGKGSPIESIELIPSSGGVFEVTVDGQLVFSKKALKRHDTEKYRSHFNRKLPGETPNRRLLHEYWYELNLALI